MDKTETALCSMGAVEEAEDRSREADETWDRKGKGLDLGLSWTGVVVECWSIAYECGHHRQLAQQTGTHEPHCRTSTPWASSLNRRMPNGTYGGVRGWG